MKTQHIPETIGEANAMLKDLEREMARIRCARRELELIASRAVCAEQGHNWTPESLWFVTKCRRCGARK